MRTAALLGGVILFCVIQEYVIAGRDLYHAGWYNVALAAAAIWLLLSIKGVAAQLERPRARAGMWLFGFGIAAVAFAGVASGLLGPDDRTVVGAPGSSVRDVQTGGELVFPLAQSDDPSVVLRRGNSEVEIGSQRFTPSALLRSIPRTVVSVDARDARGAHLTITQPTGAEFLSPVLLLQSRQTINGLSLPYDSFTLPAVHRIVKTVLFSATEAASLPALAAAHGAVVLFDLEDETGASIPHAIAIAANGRTAVVGGIRLTPTVLTYPAVQVISIPDLDVVVLGGLAVIAGLLLTRSANQATISQR